MLKINLLLLLSLYLQPKNPVDQETAATSTSQLRDDAFSSPNSPKVDRMRSTINHDIINSTDDSSTSTSTSSSSSSSSNSSNIINSASSTTNTAAAAMSDKVYELNKFGLSIQDKILESFSCALYPNKGSILSQGR